MDEEKLDRRAHWIQVALMGLIAATVWVCKIQFELAGVEKDMENQKAKRDQSVQEIRDRINSDHDLNIAEQKDIEWLKGGCKNAK